MGNVEPENLCVPSDELRSSRFTNVTMQLLLVKHSKIQLIADEVYKDPLKGIQTETVYSGCDPHGRTTTCGDNLGSR